jgi:predicted DNA-binding transcriptional regulator AlpA
MDLQNEILTIDDLAALLKMNRRQIYEMTSNRGRARHSLPVPLLRINGNLRFRRSDIAKWLDDWQMTAQKGADAAPAPTARPREPLVRGACSVAVVIVLVPVALGVPAVFMLIPPPVTFTPATFPGLVQFTTLMVCLGAVASMFLDGLVEFMLRMNDSALTPVLVFGVEWRYSGEKQRRRQ